MGIIWVSFPKLLPLAHLFYGNVGTVRHRWDDGTWREISMEEGVIQGFRLSAIFASLFVDQILRPLDAQLRECTRTRLADGDSGDHGMGFSSNLFAWIDDVSVAVSLVDLKCCCFIFFALVRPYLLNLNTFKTRIRTSTNGSSIISNLALTDSALAEEIESTIAEFSIKKLASLPDEHPS